jgi:hypothetical protein
MGAVLLSVRSSVGTGADVVRVLSLGAGVQSSTLLLMAVQGELEIDSAVFADTGWEPRATYEHLRWLEAEANVAGLAVYRVSAGNLRTDALTPNHRFASMPLRVLHEDGSQGILRRQCTKEYKVRPVQRQLRYFGATAAKPVTLLMGISLDEVHRMTESRVRYVRHSYPLVDRRMTRLDCLNWLKRHGYPEPPKSACIGCPYRADSLWRALTPEEWADAVDFDQRIRHLPGVDGATYLHRSYIPLASVDLRSAQDRGQMDLFGEECEGMCGV